MAKVLAKNLEGVALDWVVLKATGYDFKDFNLRYMDAYEFSTNWGQGGPILSKARISRTIDHSGLWIAYQTDGYTEGDEGKKYMQCDRDELTAGLRCYVTSVCGLEIEIPDALVAHMRSEVKKVAAPVHLSAADTSPHDKAKVVVVVEDGCVSYVSSSDSKIEVVLHDVDNLKERGFSSERRDALLDEVASGCTQIEVVDAIEYYEASVATQQGDDKAPGVDQAKVGYEPSGP
jgi:hypothetical protein